jgi:hypothetical protein
MRALRIAARATALIVAMGAGASAQWLNHPTADIPRTPDGKPNLAAPVPRTPDGKPQLAGLWRPSPGLTGDIARSLKAGEKPSEVPFQPWAEALCKERRANSNKDDPTANCIVGGVPRSDLVGYPFKILQVPGMVVILYEAVHSYRQIFTDGRKLPANPQPTWFGYSVGHWEGDALVVETTGFNDQGWLDNAGKPATDQLHVIERFVRKDFGNLDIQITIDDPKAYTKPWTVTQPLAFQADTELLEYICNENNKYFELVKDYRKDIPTRP